MRTDSKYNVYTDFLKDKRFIQWQLMPDESLNSYWDEFFTAHPELQDMSQKSILYLKKKGMNKSSLSETEKTEILEKIQTTLRKEKKINRRTLLWYASASAAAIALIVIGINLFSSTPKQSTTFFDQELIIGELLNNEDIQLITSEESILFQSDVEVTLDKEGTAEIIQSNNETSKIQIAKDELNSLIVPYGKRSTITLADGSKVWLNSGSVLEFPAQFSEENREIHLISGEMYIEVTPDREKTFYVHTSDFKVMVTGTKFNITAYADNPKSVVLVEGGVSLQAESRNEQQLLPNEQAILADNGIFITQHVEVDRFISWKNGYLTLDKTPMTEVLRQIGRYYNLSFNFEHDIDLQKRTCTGKIYLSDNLDNVMTTVGLLSSTQYKKEGNQISIINK